MSNAHLELSPLGRWLVLFAAFGGWLCAGMQMATFTLVTPSPQRAPRRDVDRQSQLRAAGRAARRHAGEPSQELLWRCFPHDGIGQRIIALPIPNGDIRGLEAGKAGILFVATARPKHFGSEEDGVEGVWAEPV